MEKQEVPKVGEYYHFWDDGKTGPSRHYICKIENIIKIKDAKNILVNVPEYNITTHENVFCDVTLYDRWQYQVKEYDWLYSTDTDYIIEISCPNYDENNLYAVRTKDGGWFTIDVHSWWQSGRLDVTGKIFEDVTSFWEQTEGYVPESYVPADEEHYDRKF